MNAVLYLAGGVTLGCVVTTALLPTKHTYVWSLTTGSRNGCGVDSMCFENIEIPWENTLVYLHTVQVCPKSTKLA